MTKHESSDRATSDRPALILPTEPTRDMVLAGVAELLGFDLERDDAGETVKRIWAVMMRASGRTS
jgi:hypothetical protein